MTEILEQDTETTERRLLVREYAAEFAVGDGRTVDVRIVPYGVPTEVSDDGRTFYREQWEPGAFDDQLVAGHRLKVLLNFEHLSGISNVVGRGVSLRSAADGLHGSFRMQDGPAGDTALDLVNDGILDGVSLEAYPKKSVRRDGVVSRVKAHLHNVALCRNPAYSDAKVLAVREETSQETILDEVYLPVEMDPELIDRCRSLGIELPQRYQAHPDEQAPPATDTPETAPATTESNDDHQE